MLGILRAFNAMSANGASQSDGYVNSPYARDMGQEVFRPTTVFSLFPAGLLRAAGVGRACSAPSSASWTRRPP